jgi:hypothetical protein
MASVSRRKKKPMLPPAKPAVVQRVVDEQTQQRRNFIFFQCRILARRRELMLPEVWAAMYADWILAQVQQKMEEQMAKIVIPKPGTLLPEVSQ